MVFSALQNLSSSTAIHRHDDAQDAVDAGDSDLEFSGDSLAGYVLPGKLMHLRSLGPRFRRPALVPALTLALAIPSPWRSSITSRLNCAKLKMTLSISRPVGVAVSRFMARTRNAAPLIHRSALFALSFGGQPQCCTSGQRNVNYAYAALESQIRIKAISDGYDPTIGIMHEGSDGSSRFIFDLMEPEPPRVDRAMLDLVKGHVFDPADLPSEATAFAGLIRTWRGWSWRRWSWRRWSWRRFLHSKFLMPTGRSRREADIADRSRSA
jgi:CRISPR associated protein Cas1